ncbi:hypothetical protein CesoFtcFv8_003608 [Champsocephalus esox]|uniref:Uncharacterized protein n=1 Tax=Champsocephalus esox TaxID=159716 RepID=A0AAN8CSW6_9TELE|nr:hypothetical protein CesoFtcFv8_003608 [Champsocephalus esox]
MIVNRQEPFCLLLLPQPRKGNPETVPASPPSSLKRFIPTPLCCATDAITAQPAGRLRSKHHPVVDPTWLPE